MLTCISGLRRYGLGLVVAPTLLMCACSHEAPPAQMPKAPIKAPEPVAEKPPARPAYLVVSQGIRTKCGVPEEPADSPQFDFDEAELRPRGEGILDAIATCMRDGSLKGIGVTIIGHTDPRGADKYNQSLGMERAKAAGDYLTAHGIPMTSLTVESRGEKDASGTDSSSWQLDRRVEIEESVSATD